MPTILNVGMVSSYWNRRRDALPEVLYTFYAYMYYCTGTTYTHRYIQWVQLQYSSYRKRKSVCNTHLYTYVLVISQQCIVEHTQCVEVYVCILYVDDFLYYPSRIPHAQSNKFLWTLYQQWALVANTEFIRKFTRKSLSLCCIQSKFRYK